MKYILGLLLWAHLSMGQTLKPKQEALIRNTIASQFGWEIANSAILNLGRASFCKVGKDTLYKLPGYHYVFKIKNDTAFRIDKSKFHGIDNYSTIFNWQNKLFCIGGYGMFLSHSTLKYFNNKTHEWTFVPVKGTSPASINGLCFKKDSIIYCINNFNSGNNTDSDIIINGLYCLNLNTMNWTNFELDKVLTDNLKNDFKMQLYALNDFIIQFSFNKLLIIDMHSLDVYIVPCENINYKYSSIIKRVNFNTLYTENDSISIYKSSILKYKIGNLYPYKTQFNWFFYFLLFICITLLFFYFRIRSKHSIQNNIATIQEEGIVKNLLENVNTILSVDELDTVFNIIHLETDSKRLRRHRILSEIERQKPGLISRIKDPEDKRKFLYQINKK